MKSGRRWFVTFPLVRNRFGSHQVGFVSIIILLKFSSIQHTTRLWYNGNIGRCQNDLELTNHYGLNICCRYPALDFNRQSTNANYLWRSRTRKDCVTQSISINALDVVVLPAVWGSFKEKMSPKNSFIHLENYAFVCNADGTLDWDHYASISNISAEQLESSCSSKRARCDLWMFQSCMVRRDFLFDESQTRWKLVFVL